MDYDSYEHRQLQALRVAAGGLIDPDTSEISWRHACMFDPYNDGLELTEELQLVGREQYARAPGTAVWVHLRDLPEPTRDAIWKRYEQLQRRGRLLVGVSSVHCPMCRTEDLWPMSACYKQQSNEVLVELACLECELLPATEIGYRLCGPMSKGETIND
jgi:hypothetical protein